MRGRPPSGKTLVVEALMDSQIFVIDGGGCIEAAILAVRQNLTERAIELMERGLRDLQLTREAQRTAAGELEGVKVGR